MVKAMQSVLKVSYQPDEGATVKQVFFADPAKPTWRSFVTKINDARVGIWFVARRPADSPAVLPVAEQVFPELKLPGERPGVAANTVSVAAEVDAISKGAHTTFPSLHSVSGPSSTTNGMAVLEVKNDTLYALTVLFSGPTERRVNVSAGASVSVELLPGSYRFAGRVDAAGVQPSYSEHELKPSRSVVQFYIQR